MSALKKTDPRWIWLSFLTLAVLITYANCYNNQFLWDDEFLIQKNSYLRDWSNAGKMLVSNSTAGFGGVDNFYRPTQNLYYLVIYQTFGLSEPAFHAGNVLLHLINTLLLFFLVLRLFNNQWVAGVTALLWGIHPTHIEAITYISGTADPMGLLFFLLCALTFPFRNEEHYWIRLASALLLFALSLISKEAMIVTPALLMLIIGFQSKKPWNWRNYTPTLPFWFLAGFYMLARKLWLNFDKTYDFYKAENIYTENILYRIYTFLATLPEYAKILFFPTNLHMERSFPVFVNFTSGPVLFGATILLTLISLCLYQWAKRDRIWPTFCLLFYFAAFVPMTGILLPVNSFILEHWLYLPSIGFFIAIAMILEPLHRQKPILTNILLVTAMASLIGLSWVRNNDWQTPISFYNNILKYSEGSARVHNNLGMAYAELENWDLAIKHYQTSIERSDSYAQTRYNLARLLIRQQRYQEALENLNRSLEIRPDFSYSLKLREDLINYLKRNQ